MTRADLVAGIDEAGRGPLLGPLVVAVVTLAPGRAAALRRLGVTDSKKFGSDAEARRRRAELAREIRRRADAVRVAVAEVQEVDRAVSRGLLNRLEQELALGLLADGPIVSRIVADGETLFAPLASRLPPDVTLRAVDHGEEAHVAVAAASIVAKARRDELFSCIVARYAHSVGPVNGGGYINDATRRFLLEYTRRHGALPPEVRRSWRSDLRFLADLIDPQRHLGL